MISKEDLPLLQLVRIDSSVKSNQQRGSGSTTLDMTGGSMAVVALGSTGCSIMCSSSLSAETLEFDRSLLEPVTCVSVRWSPKREETLFLWRTEDCAIVSSAGIGKINRRMTYGLATMQHSHAEIPQQESAVLAY